MRDIATKALTEHRFRGVGLLQTAATPMSRLSMGKGARRTVNYGVGPIGALPSGFLGELIEVHAALWVGAVAGPWFGRSP